ncbi:MAG: nucleotidyltransferase family protein [Chloroflexi bacterium]|nr:nucleotidyltransferase family protein [Chloroflexota bacterium]
MMTARLPLPPDTLAEFCRRWNITELALFGSVLRDDFRPDSDVDLLVTFAPAARWSFVDLEDMESELTALLGRKVDLVERAAVEQSSNYIRRRRILTTAEPIYGR